MVKTIRALLVAAAVLGGVSGCNLDIGIFPDRMTSYEGYADLSGSIENDRIWDFTFQLIRDSSNGAEYLVLASDNRGFGGVHVMVFDANLKVLGAYTLDELDAMDPDNQFNGRGAMVDSGGKIVVGNRRFTVSSRKLVFADSASQLWQQGLAVPEGFDKNITDIRCEDTSFRYRRFQPDWTFTMDVEKSIGWGAWSKLVGAWHQGDYLLFVMFHDISPAHIVQLDPLAFTSGGYAEPIIGGVTTVSSITAPGDFAWETLGYTDEGFAVFRWDQNAYVRFDEGGLSIGSPFGVSDKERPHEQRHLYGRTGGWYILRQKDMTLERRAWWWK